MGMFRNIKRSIDRIFTLHPFTPAANQTHQSSPVPAAVIEPNIPQGVYEIRMQAVTQNVRYTLDGTDPTPTSGFVLVAGNDPITIPIIIGRTRLKFIQAAAGAILEYQFGE
jgi:hypothetical protein